MLRNRGLVAAFVLASGTVFAVASANADTITVTDLTDANPSTIGSLRWAVEEANTNTDVDRINFNLSEPTTPKTITLLRGVLPIRRGPLTIEGPGAALLTIDGNATGGIFSVISAQFDPACPPSSVPPDFLVSISDLTLKNGQRTGNSKGGAILSLQKLKLDRLVIQDNIARAGGGVAWFTANPNQFLTINNVEFRGNKAKPTGDPLGPQRGGALYIYESCSGPGIPLTQGTSVTITDSLFYDNSSQPDGQYSYSAIGGAIGAEFIGDLTITGSRIINNRVEAPNQAVPSNLIYRGGGIYANTRSLTIDRSEISGNTVIDPTNFDPPRDVTRGGGISVFNNAAELQGPNEVMNVRITNSTISGNHSDATTGAMFVVDNVAVKLNNSTVSDNSANPTRTGGIGFNVGATAWTFAALPVPPLPPPPLPPASRPTLTVASSILANNNGDGGDVAANLSITGFTINATNSLIEKVCPSPSCDIAVAGSGNLLGYDPLLGDLAFNGGSTRTHALLAGSPAINTGSNPLNLDMDQRGVARLQGSAPDMGAYELFAPVSTPAGPAVTVDLVVAIPAELPPAEVAIVFDNVTSGGVTSVSASTAGLPPPTGFTVGDPPVHYDVSTTATFSGNVELCFSWTDGQFANEDAVRLLHFESNAWLDVTTSVDTLHNVACGTVASLSPFALLEVAAYQFAGFFQPVDNPPTLNTLKAGQAVPVKFSLGGNRGLNIFSPGYPASKAVSCPGSTSSDAIEETVTAGASGLQYNATTDQYTYVWKTSSAWASSCRLLILNFKDGSQHLADFQFKK